MANVKWSGIEQKKYGLTARWYVSAQYGNDTDVDALGLYDPSTNPTGWGGPLYPFKNIDNVSVETSITNASVVVDSGMYSATETAVMAFDLIGDGNVVLTSSTLISTNILGLYNITIFNSSALGGQLKGADIRYFYSTIQVRNSVNVRNVIAVESVFTTASVINGPVYNWTIINCTGIFGYSTTSPLGIVAGFIIINSPNLKLALTETRPIGKYADYSIIIGTVTTNYAINGKTSGVTIEDFKIDGNYFSKSFSEVDLFGNASGSGATVAQLQTLFNNYFSPVYLDNWQYLDLSLKPTVDDRVRYGGLSGHFIGALPVGYSYDIATLWTTYQDAGNTSNVEIDGVSGNLVLSAGQTTGVFTTTEIVLPNAVEADVSMFFKNNVYNSSGVAVQRIDTTDDEVPSNLVEQRTVYSYRLKTSPDSGTALGVWKEYELDRAPTVDASGNSNINDSFDKQTETTQIIKKFALEITLRDL